MSLPLLKATARRHATLWLVFLGVLLMYLVTILFVFQPDDLQALEDMIAFFPEDLLGLVGFSTRITDLTSYLASWLYGLLMFALPLVYSIIVCNRLMAKLVDDRSLAQLLATPTSRVRLVVTQGVYALLSQALLFAALFGTGLVLASWLHPGLLDQAAFFRLNLATLLANQTVMMVCFFFSCLFNTSARAVGAGGGLSTLFLLMLMIGGLSESVACVKKASPYGWFDPVDLVKNGHVASLFITYAVLIVLLFAASVAVFRRKQLPI